MEKMMSTKNIGGLQHLITKPWFIIAVGLSLFLLITSYHSPETVQQGLTRVQLTIGAYNCPVTKPFPALSTRDDLHKILESEGMKVGVELGVQRGIFAEHLLKNWNSCQKYYLVDVWRQQENYVDGANVEDNVQENFFKDTQNRLKPWESKTVFLRNYTSEAVKHIPSGELDFVYVDARHDYCGCMQDMELYWPLLKPGGIMAGHDYKDANEVKQIHANEDWSICQDGTKNDGAVRGAVEEFAKKNNLQIFVTWKDAWPTWIVRKPEVQQKVLNSQRKFIRKY